MAIPALRLHAYENCLQRELSHNPLHIVVAKLRIELGVGPKNSIHRSTTEQALNSSRARKAYHTSSESVLR